jgi:hypothetical protein
MNGIGVFMINKSDFFKVCIGILFEGSKEDHFKFESYGDSAVKLFNKLGIYKKVYFKRIDTTFAFDNDRIYIETPTPNVYMSCGFIATEFGNGVTNVLDLTIEYSSKNISIYFEYYNHEKEDMVKILDDEWNWVTK